MGEIRNRQDHPNQGIEYSEIIIPNDAQIGNGSFVTSLRKGALIPKNQLSSVIYNAPIFQMSVNINPNLNEIVVLLGKADGSNPADRKVFSIPTGISTQKAHILIAYFNDWKITDFLFDEHHLVSR